MLSDLPGHCEGGNPVNQSSERGPVNHWLFVPLPRLIIQDSVWELFSSFLASAAAAWPWAFPEEASRWSSSRSVAAAAVDLFLRIVETGKVRRLKWRMGVLDDETVIIDLLLAFLFLPTERITSNIVFVVTLLPSIILGYSKWSGTRLGSKQDTTVSELKVFALWSLLNAHHLDTHCILHWIRLLGQNAKKPIPERHLSRRRVTHSTHPSCMNTANWIQSCENNGPCYDWNMYNSY